MQSYQSEASGSGVRGTLDPLPATSNGRPDDIGKYRTRYEEAMNPFEVFRGRVSVWGDHENYVRSSPTDA